MCQWLGFKGACLLYCAHHLPNLLLPLSNMHKARLSSAPLKPWNAAKLEGTWSLHVYDRSAGACSNNSILSYALENNSLHQDMIAGSSLHRQFTSLHTRGQGSRCPPPGLVGALASLPPWNPPLDSLKQGSVQ